MLATTFSIVAVFLPVGFMGGIVGRFFHQFGITVVAAVLISMFVSFTLDPMLSSVWPDPAIAHGTPRQAQPLRPHHRPRHRLVRTRHRVLSHIYQVLLKWSLRHRFATWCWPSPSSPPAW